MTTTNRPRVGGNAAIDEVVMFLPQIAARVIFTLFGLERFLPYAEEILSLLLFRNP